MSEWLDNTARWIWHPRISRGQSVFLCFRRTFSLHRAARIRIRVSADQYYVLSLDGRRLGAGPHTSPLSHWSYDTYTLSLKKGRHEIFVEVWALGQDGPLSRETAGGGFLLMAEGVHADLLTTGRAAWAVSQIAGKRLWPKRSLVIGKGLELEERGTRPESGHYVKAVPIASARASNAYGEWISNYHLWPSELPRMLNRPISPGAIRWSRQGVALELREPLDAAGCQSGACVAWERLLREGRPVTVPAHRTVRLLWDLESYYCGYPDLVLSGGRGASVEWEWAEALSEHDGGELPNRYPRGNRDEVEGKYFLGFGDRFLPGGGRRVAYASHWWRSGRYCRLSIRTGKSPLVIERMRVVESRYPLRRQFTFRCDRPEINNVVSLCWRGLEMCAHDTLVDCPYYEQLNYLADARIQALAGYVSSRDDRLARRAIALGDWSREHFGIAASRSPSQRSQLISTFPLLWIGMVHDYWYWRQDEAWVRQRLEGVRVTLAYYEARRQADGGFSAIEGWNFVDWAPGWKQGIPSAAQPGACSLMSLLYLCALRQGWELEERLGSKEIAAWYGRLIRQIARSLRETFWSSSRRLWADDAGHRYWSQHAQCLAVLAGLTAERKSASVASWLERAVATKDMTPASLYFRHYLFTAYGQLGDGGAILRGLGLWQDLLAKGLKTPVEEPEPNRSDCHGWGSHPLYHLQTAIAGIRPDSPGFRTVRVSPGLGSLQYVQSRLPHPAGEIQMDVEQDDRGLHGEIVLPAGVPGHWIDSKGVRHPLSPGRNRIRHVCVRA